MNLKTFMKEFRLVQDKFYWKVYENGCLRGHLRGSNRKWEYCPITAVVKVKTGKMFRPGNYKKAAIHLNLNYYNWYTNLSRVIVNAADNDIKDTSYPNMRKNLLKATKAKGAEIKV